MIETIAALLLASLFIVAPIAIVSHETEKAVNQTTVECIEKPNICKDRYEYIKLGEKLTEIEVEKNQK